MLSCLRGERDLMLDLFGVLFVASSRSAGRLRPRISSWWARVTTSCERLKQFSHKHAQILDDSTYPTVILSICCPVTPELKRVSCDGRPGLEGERAREGERAPRGERDLRDRDNSMKLPLRGPSPSEGEEAQSMEKRIMDSSSAATGSRMRFPEITASGVFSKLAIGKLCVAGR